MKIIAISFLLGLVCAAGAEAQSVIGSSTVTGTVVDYTGSGIPDTTVVLINSKLGVRREMDTTDDGGFYAAGLVPGPGYVMKVTRTGFLELDYSNFEIPAGHTLDFRISVVQASAQARVEAEKPSVAVRDQVYALERTVSEDEMLTLPTPDRNLNALAPLAIGVAQDPATGILAFHGEPTTNAYWTDGILTTNTFFYNRPPVAAAVTEEAASEMQIVSAVGPVEFGHTMGGSLNVVTHSGGDSIHGQAYDYFNSHSLNADDRYAPGFNPPGWQHQYGGNVGGALLKKIFWFGDAEAVDGNSEELNRVFNPLITNGTGTAVVPANCTATAAQCATAETFLNSQLNRVVDTSITSYRGLAKADWRPNDFNTVSVEGDALHQRSPNGTDINTVSSNGGLLGPNGTYSDDTRYAKAAYTAVWSGNAVNNVRANWFHDRFSDYADTQALPSTGALGIDIAGSTFGGNPQLPMALSENRWEFVDNFTAALGAHFFKLGTDYSLNEDTNRQIVNSTGTYFFPTLTGFADDLSGNTGGKKDYALYTQTFGQPVVDLNTKVFNIYAQDTWKLRKMTVVFGVLWEKPWIPQPKYTNGTFFQTSEIASPAIDWSPRVGLAYQLDSHTVIRGGFGSFYQPFSGQLLEALYTGNAIYQLPITALPTETAAPVFPRIFGSPTSIPAGSADVLYAASKLRLPLAAEGTASIERTIGSGLTVSLNYLYTRGIELWSPVDTNLNTPTVTKTYTIDNAAGSAVGSYTTPIYSARTNGNFANVYELENEGSSNYSAASAVVRKGWSHGITAQASYTWSHALDDVSGPPVIGGVVAANSVPDSFHNDRGNSNFNQPNRVVVSWIWAPTFTSSKSVAARYLINGWQLSGIGTFVSGLSETPVALVNGQQFSGVSMVYTTSLNGSGEWNRVPFQPVNSLYLGREYNVDARVTRDLPITERIHAALMFEAYNAFNTQFNTSVNTIAYLATAGVLRPVPGLGVGTGAAGYPFGDNARHLQVALKITF